MAFDPTRRSRSLRNIKLSKSRPKNWPLNIEHIRVQHYSTDIPEEILSFIKGTESTRDGSTAVRVSSPIAEPSRTTLIRLINESTHPANGQHGLFATRRIPPHTHILDYFGEVHSNDREDSDYDLSLVRSHDGKYNIGVDASHKGNEARFINDFRGVRHKPNAVFFDIRSPSGELRMSVWSNSQYIEKGEEILVSYGKSWWRARDSSKQGQNPS